MIIFSFLSVACYSYDAIELEAETQAQVTDINESLIVDKVDPESTESDEFCMSESFKGVINWFAEKLEFIDEKYLRNSESDEIAEPFIEPSLIKESGVPKQPLDLTIPDIAHEGTMEIGNGLALQLPDLFADPKNQPYMKEKPGASFGGRILMDDEQLEGMEEYRFDNVRNAVRGAEVSLEFKTN